MVYKTLYLSLFLCGLKGFSQSKGEQVIQYFDQLVGLNNTGLISGFEYTPSPPAKKTHAYLLRRGWLYGNVRFRGSTYRKVALLYDLVSQQLVAQKTGPSGDIHSVVLDIDHVLWFEIGDHYFKRMENREYYGYFEIHFKGKNLSLLEHHIKRQEVDQSNFNIQYESDNIIFLRFEEELLKFKNKKTLISLFPDKKSAINRHIKANKLSINTKNIEDVKLLLSYCENL